MKWAYAISTSPKRAETTLPRTKRSLAAAGFPEPMVFVDPGRGSYRNWLQALSYLYINEPKAGRYAVFEDDILCCLGLREYLKRTTVHDLSYWNLITPLSNEEVIAGKKEGWHRTGNTARGSQALVFNRSTVVHLLSSPSMWQRLQENPAVGWFSPCSAVAKGSNGVVYEMCHNPSLVQHIGQESLVGNGFFQAKTFRGEEWDATTLLRS